MDIFRSWILNYFHLADKDRSNSLSKKECRRLLEDSFNVKMPESVFEQLFQVIDRCSLPMIIFDDFQDADKSEEGLLSPEEFFRFFQLLTQRKDLYEIMQK